MSYFVYKEPGTSDYIAEVSWVDYYNARKLVYYNKAQKGPRSFSKLTHTYTNRTYKTRNHQPGFGGYDNTYGNITGSSNVAIGYEAGTTAMYRTYATEEPNPSLEEVEEEEIEF